MSTSLLALVFEVYFVIGIYFHLHD